MELRPACDRRGAHLHRLHVDEGQPRPVELQVARTRPLNAVRVDGYPDARFFAADDFAESGELLSEIKVRGEIGEVLCRYPEDPIPARHAAFRVVGLPTRMAGKGVHHAWAVVANIADHETMIELAGLRMTERDR
jgi:hypothetical protein